MEEIHVGFAFTGSFCTYAKAMETLERVAERYGSVTPIVTRPGKRSPAWAGQNVQQHTRLSWPASAATIWRSWREFRMKRSARP